jgi:ABC-type transporter Mla subunit MlaD
MNSIAAKPQPQPPGTPAEMQVRLTDERQRLAKLAKSLDELAARTAQTPAGPQLADAVAALQEATALLQKRVGDARHALSGTVMSKGVKGEVIDQKQIATITEAGVAEAVKAVRAALVQVLRSQGLEPSAPASPSPSPAASSASPAPSSSTGAP